MAIQNLKINKKELESVVVLDTSSIKRKSLSIEELLVFATENDCSDLYIKMFDYPYVSKFGKIIRLPCQPTTKEQWNTFYDKKILKELNADYVRQKLLDTSIEINIPPNSIYYDKLPINLYRYRVSFGFSEERNIATFRMIKPKKPTFDTIDFNKQCINALQIAYGEKTGICIEAGPTGSGKSTTLAACINTFTQANNVLDNKVIITLEDPIENVFYSTDNVKITQKELGKDFLTFNLGIKAALREHPNMVIVGEMRDKEVICTTIEAARTGHLVSTTFHASDVGGTIARILYHLDNDKNLAFDLVSQLNIIISQRMLKRNDKYLVDTQYLLFNSTIKDYLITIVENPNLNIAVELNKLIKDPAMQKAGLAKDWEYPGEV